VAEQLDFFEELDHPTEQKVWVKLLIEYQTREYPNLTQMAFLQFVDEAPYFQKSQVIIRAYHDISIDYEATAWHKDLPDEDDGEIEVTHEGNIVLH